MIKRALAGLLEVFGLSRQDLYFFKMNLADPTYRRRRRFNRWVREGLNLQREDRLNPVSFESGKAVVTADPFGIRYRYLPELDARNSGENLDVQFEGTRRDRVELDLIAANLGPDAVFIDVGANLGHYSLNATKRTGCVSYAFEPIPHVFAVLEENASLNGLDRVRPVARGLSDKRGRAAFTVDLQATGNRIAQAGDARTVEVELDTLDHFAAERGLERVDFIKADIQGAEVLFVRGAAETIRKHRPHLMLESDASIASFGFRRSELFDLVGSMGYARCAAITKDGLVECPSFGPIPGAQNYVFSARELIRPAQAAPADGARSAA